MKARGLLFQNIQSLKTKILNVETIDTYQRMISFWQKKKYCFFFVYFPPCQSLNWEWNVMLLNIFLLKRKKYSFSYMQNHYKYLFWWITYLSPLPLNFFLPIVLILILPNQKRLNKTQSHQNMIPKWSVHVYFLPNFIIFVAFYN